jgi:hypothetical protein
MLPSSSQPDAGQEPRDLIAEDTDTGSNSPRISLLAVHAYGTVAVQHFQPRSLTVPTVNWGSSLSSS